MQKPKIQDPATFDPETADYFELMAECRRLALAYGLLPDRARLRELIRVAKPQGAGGLITSAWVSAMIS